MTFWLSAILILGLALVLEPAALAQTDRLSPGIDRAVGIGLLVTIAGYVAWTGLWDRPLRIRNWNLQLPSARATAAQPRRRGAKRCLRRAHGGDRLLAVGAVDICCAAGVLYVLLPAEAQTGFAAFVGIFIAANTIGVISHSPGGIGIFEAAMLLALPDVDRASMVGALLVYRCLYYLLPLALAAALLAWHEFAQRRETLAPVISRARELSDSVVPPLIGIAVLTGGVVLLFSGATPVLDERLVLLRRFLPLPFVEASHFFASLVGLSLLFLSRGLFRRLDGAYHLTLGLLGAGIAFSLLKGLDYEEAGILAFVSLLLLLSRPAFRRKASMLGQRTS